MTHPLCLKEGPITALEVTTENIQRTLNEQHETMKELVQVLKQVSAQSQQINNLQASVNRQERDLADHGKRIGAIEVKNEGHRVRIGFLMGGMATVSSIGTALVTKFLK